MQIERHEAVRYEGVVEPVQPIRGEVEVAQRHLGGQQAVNVLDLILGQVEVGQVRQGRKTSLIFKGGDEIQKSQN